jgi:glycosyltransferase involved in cell wall biosynthesis
MNVTQSNPVEIKNNNHPYEVLKGKDIVIFSIQHYDSKIGSNCRDIANQLAKHNRVLYVCFPITRKSYLSHADNPELIEHCDVIKNKLNPIKSINKNLWILYPTSMIESVKWLPNTTLFKAATSINNRRFAKNIKEAIDVLNFKDIILFNDNDIYNGFYLKELLRPSLYIYYFKDFLQGYDYWKKHSSVMEPELIKKSDLVVTNSIFYQEYCATLTDNAFYIGQGCQLGLFVNDETRPVPDDMKDMKYPIIGYTGVLDSQRLDENIIEIIARDNPDWTIVMAGPIDDVFSKSRLHKYANIHFLGRKTLQELPNYVQAFDVCMNPQLFNNITRGNYPLKIDEYLAMGKPVVASRTKAMKLFEDHTYLADKAEEYPALVKKALAENSPEKVNERIRFAKSHTWENVLLELNMAVEKAIGNKAKSA